MKHTNQYKYEALASYITGLVDCGTLLPGDRLPSLRRISMQRGQSVSTAMQAYRLLEDRGVIEARPQSGFFVSAQAAKVLAQPQVSRPPAKPANVSVSSTVLKLLEYASDARLAPLGCAIPSPELLSAGRLDRFLAQASRRRGVACNTYSPIRGDRRLRREIAKRAIHWGKALSPDDIVITCGCTEALALALQTTCKPGDVVGIESPTYFGLLQAIEVLNLRAFELPTHPVDGVDLSALRKALKAKALHVCLFSSSFNNPLGSTMSDTKKIAILDLLAKHNVPLIEDDIYGDIYFNQTSRPTPFMALDRHEITMYCNSLSKTIAPGYRVGWIVPGKRLQRVLEQKFALTLSAPVLPQIATAEYLSSGGYDHHLRRIRRIFAENIDRMLRIIELAFPKGTKVTRPRGGYVLWLQLPSLVRTDKLFGLAVKQGICFAPGRVFSASGRYQNCLRLSCGFKWTAGIEKSVWRLGELAISLMGATRAMKRRGAISANH